jgi:hypothetical protein
VKRKRTVSSRGSLQLAQIFVSLYRRIRNVARNVLNLARMRRLDALEQVLGACRQDNLVLLAEQVPCHGGTNALAGTTDDEDFGHDQLLFCECFDSSFFLGKVVIP